jgi:RNA polymerase sigma-70 factor (ECF subfamily)
MVPVMPEESSTTNDLLTRVRGGDGRALAELFAHYRERLRRMVRLRLDRRLQGRVDPSAVLDHAFRDVARAAPDYLAQPSARVFLWLRQATGQRLAAVHRQFLGNQIHLAGQEVSLYRGALPPATSASLAAQLLKGLAPATQGGVRAETQIRLQEALNTLDPTDREVLVLRHFEELSNNETAEVLAIPKAAASNRYLHALKRLKEILNNLPGFFNQGRP